ncbi:hypothetical protein [Streptomyces achmelvichensis]|uniref:hypothetical protein n=1 Tax=Streptomyces achmelvichensis TaxID=3134111 RepID=UPI003C12B780
MRRGRLGAVSGALREATDAVESRGFGDSDRAGPVMGSHGQLHRGIPLLAAPPNYTAASAALDLYRHGRILVMVPTLELLVQTAEW